MRKVITSVALIIASFSVGYWICGHRISSRTFPAEMMVRREYIRDTTFITVTQPAETIYTGSFIAVPVGIHDTVYLERERRVYRDSVYFAEVSGISPSLDSLVIYPRHTVETYSYPLASVRFRPQRWTFGLTAGATLTPRGISPGITLGLTYNLATF